MTFMLSYLGVGPPTPRSSKFSCGFGSRVYAILPRTLILPRRTCSLSWCVRVFPVASIPNYVFEVRMLG